ncbi:MAG: hypothetical protein J2P34_11085 [Actinobacteria bacterium]|nr:hypothetical protein [Actinomycetota bacterium]
MSIDTHCHVIVEEMTARRVPADWRPAVSRDGGRYRLGFRGRELGPAEELVLSANAARLLGARVG